MDRQGNPEFVFLAGDPALDLVNTVMVIGGAPADLLDGPGALAAWVGASGLAARFGTPVEISPAVYAQVIGLRTAVKAVVGAVAAGDPVPNAELDVLNDALVAAPGTRLRRASGGALTRETVIDLSRDTRWLPWLLADAAAALLTGDAAGRIRRCANHVTCVLMFVDTSRSRSRRWCSMELCGNRSKVAAHAARSRDRVAQT
ncbi:ABATE domain-containing protein [Gordonia sp. PP30]|uniref:CGNR zinc finger domain-containing protein n=1 Tax=Gordonia sp. PP30 TaxID=2935861 RepID=UPI001FFE2DD6|nr:ABATE domain-containing protein [Gordonia sp. PP30]UQE76805.1 ABATE domain-containing protein [Gordonia sp. PP30]